MAWRKTALGVAFFVAAMIAAGAYYFAHEQRVEPLTKLRIGYQPLASSWVFYVANAKLPGREKSFFEEEGLQVEPVRFDSANSAAESMLRGDIATDSAITMTVLFNIEDRSPGSLKCFAFQMHTKSQFLESFIAKKGAGIKGYADLKGKTIGVFPGSLNQLLTRILLKDYLNPEKDVTIVQMAPAIQLQAIALGQVDALISYEPTTSLALKQGLAEVVEDSPWAKHIFEPFPVAAYCFTTKFISENPQTASRIVRAWFKAIDYVRADPSSAANTITAYTGIEPDLARELRQPMQQKVTEVDRAAIQRLVDLFRRIDIISKTIDTSDIYYVPK